MNGAALGRFAVSRREFLRLSALLTLSGTLTACSRASADDSVRIGYLPITDAAPLLVAHGKGLFEAEGLHVERPVLFRGWSEITEAFLAGRINVAHLLSPVVLWARYAGHAPLKMVAWNHIDGSTLTVANGIERLQQLGGRTVAVPHWYSVHNIVLQQLLRRGGLEAVPRPTQPLAANEVGLVVMAPADMVPALAGGRIAGFIVAEPFNAIAEANGIGRVLRFTGDVWQRHACCQVILNEHDLAARPQWAQKVVSAIVRAQLWLNGNRAEAARFLSMSGAGKYTPHSEEVLRRVLDPTAAETAAYVERGAIRHPDWHEPRIAFQPYPFPGYTELLVGLLRQTKVEGDTGFLQTLDPAFAARDLTDDRFVRTAIADVGGLAAFGLAERFTRSEVLQP